MKNIYLLIGIPGSGKSYWLQDKNMKNSCVLDDISQLNNPLDLLKSATSNPDIKNIYISDVNFLELSVLKKAQSMLNSYMGNEKYNMHYIIFKSNKHISEQNVKLRNDGRQVSATIQRFSHKYEEVIEYLSNQRTDIIETQIYKKAMKKIK